MQIHKSSKLSENFFGWAWPKYRCGQSGLWTLKIDGIN